MVFALLIQFFTIISNPCTSAIHRAGWADLGFSLAEVSTLTNELPLHFENHPNFSWKGLQFLVTELEPVKLRESLFEIQKSVLADRVRNRLKWQNPIFRLEAEQLLELSSAIEVLLTAIRSQRIPMTEADLRIAFGGIRNLLSSPKGKSALIHLPDLIQEFKVAAYLVELGYPVAGMRMPIIFGGTKIGEVDILLKDESSQLTIVETKINLRHYKNKKDQLRRYEALMNADPAQTGLNFQKIILFVSGGFSQDTAKSFSEDHPQIELMTFKEAS